MGEDDGFLARWSRRKALVKDGVAVPKEAPSAATSQPPQTGTSAQPGPLAAASPGAAVVAAPTLSEPVVAELETPALERPPAPTLDDVARLTRGSDYARFVAADVDPGVRNAAMKKLFSDPHYNLMDGLDTYIDDYGKPDPIPLAMLRQMNQSKWLGLFDDEERAEALQTSRTTVEPAPAAASPDGAGVASDAKSPEPDVACRDPASEIPDENADLRLQQDHGAGRSGPDEGARA